MKTYKFEPGPCYTENGKTYRPFYLDGTEFCRLDVAKMLYEDEKSKEEITILCEAIKNKTGAIVSPGELPFVISKRKIEVEDNA